MNKGLWYALGAYGAWGLFPIYWKSLHHVPALQLISHRVLWSWLILLGVLAASRQFGAFRAALTLRALRVYVTAALIIGVNWLIYIWGVNAGYILETSLGYFINPLVSVLLGVIVLRERLRAGQWLPLGLAAAGVLYLTLNYGSPPWIALALAVTFGAYGLIKKTAPLGSLYGLTLETGLLFAPALLYLLYTETTGENAFLHTSFGADILLMGAGLVTTGPLLLFASAARRIPLSQMGLLQYLAPTLQFLLGVLVYREPFSSTQLIGFVIVWAALALFVLEGFLARRAQSDLSPSPLEKGEEVTSVL